MLHLQVCMTAEKADWKTITTTTIITSGVSFVGRPQFEESRQAPGYSQASAAAMALPDTPPWSNGSLPPASAAAVKAPLPVPKDIGNMAPAFTMHQQHHPLSGSATPTLSSCSTVRAGSQSSEKGKVSLGSECICSTVLSVFGDEWGLEGPKVGRVCVGITGVDVWKDQTVNHVFVRTHLCLCFFLCCYILSSSLQACPFFSRLRLICLLLFFTLCRPLVHPTAQQSRWLLQLCGQWRESGTDWEAF